MVALILVCRIWNRPLRCGVEKVSFSVSTPPSLRAEGPHGPLRFLLVSFLDMALPCLQTILLTGQGWFRGSLPPDNWGSPPSCQKMCAPHPWQGSLNVLLRRIFQQPSAVSSPAAASCCSWNFNWTQDSFPLPVLRHCPVLITHQLWPSCYIPHQRWRHAPGVWADFPSASYHGALSLLGLCFESNSINVKYYELSKWEVGKPKNLKKLNNWIKSEKFFCPSPPSFLFQLPP